MTMLAVNLVALGVLVLASSGIFFSTLDNPSTSPECTMRQ